MGVLCRAVMCAVQDQMGDAVLQAVGAIPDGVLLFMPSYTLMTNLVNRWKVSSSVTVAAGSGSGSVRSWSTAGRSVVVVPCCT